MDELNVLSVSTEESVGATLESVFEMSVETALAVLDMPAVEDAMATLDEPVAEEFVGEDPEAVQLDDAAVVPAIAVETTDLQSERKRGRRGGRRRGGKGRRKVLPVLGFEAVPAQSISVPELAESFCAAYAASTPIQLSPAILPTDVISAVQQFVTRENVARTAAGQAPFGPFEGDVFIHACCRELSHVAKRFLRWVFETRIGLANYELAGLAVLGYLLPSDTTLDNDQNIVVDIAHAFAVVLHTGFDRRIWCRGYLASCDVAEGEYFLGGAENNRWDKSVHGLPSLSKPEGGYRPDQFAEPRARLELGRNREGQFELILAMLRALRAFGVVEDSCRQLDGLARIYTKNRREQLIANPHLAGERQATVEYYVNLIEEAGFYFKDVGLRPILPTPYLGFARNDVAMREEAPNAMVELTGCREQFIPLASAPKGIFRHALYNVWDFADVFDKTKSEMYQGRRILDIEPIDGDKYNLKLLSLPGIETVAAAAFDKTWRWQLLPQVFEMPGQRPGSRRPIRPPQLQWPVPGVSIDFASPWRGS